MIFFKVEKDNMIDYTLEYIMLHVSHVVFSLRIGQLEILPNILIQIIEGYSM